MYKRKKAIKAAAGINVISNIAGGVGGVADQINPQATESFNKYQPYKSKEVDKLLPVAKEVPIIGGFVKGAAGISNAVRGDGTSGLRNFAGDSLGGANTVKSIISGRYTEAIPIVGGFIKASRIKRDMRLDREKQQRAMILRGQEQSNQAFLQNTFGDGGTIDSDYNEPPLSDDQSESYAVILGGKLHKDGGNDIIDRDGDKVYETEREEILFTEDQTNKIESLIKKYDQIGDMKCLEELGRVVRDIIILETKDNSGKYDLS